MARGACGGMAVGDCVRDSRNQAQAQDHHRSDHEPARPHAQRLRHNLAEDEDTGDGDDDRGPARYKTVEEQRERLKPVVVVVVGGWSCVKEDTSLTGQVHPVLP